MADHDELLNQIAERRMDAVFMGRLRERMEQDGPLLKRMAARHAQTWDLLAEALDQIVYTRDPLPEGSPRFRLVRDDEHNYAVLYVFTYNPNTYRPEEMRHTRHEFVVPVATYSKATWTRWVFDRIDVAPDAEPALGKLLAELAKSLAKQHGCDPSEVTIGPVDFGPEPEQKRRYPTTKGLDDE